MFDYHLFSLPSGRFTEGRESVCFTVVSSSASTVPGTKQTAHNDESSIVPLEPYFIEVKIIPTKRLVDVNCLKC